MLNKLSFEFKAKAMLSLRESALSYPFEVPVLGEFCWLMNALINKLFAIEFDVKDLISFDERIESKLDAVDPVPDVPAVPAAAEDEDVSNDVSKPKRSAGLKFDNREDEDGLLLFPPFPSS